MEVFIIFIVIVLLVILIAKAVSPSSTNSYHQSNSYTKSNFNSNYQNSTEHSGNNFDTSQNNINPAVSQQKETQSAFTIRVDVSSVNSYQPKSNKYKWVKKNESISIQDYTIDNGLIYVGEWLSMDNYSYSCDSCLINPKLEIDRLHPDSNGTTLSYWPSYPSLQPQARAAYLNWLAEGKNDPNIQIGYVFLYYYGLERRLLIDLEKDIDENQIERDEILAELRRLLEIYKSNNSFRNYVSNLISFASVIYKKDVATLTEYETDKVYGEYPIHFKILLADYVLNQRPIDYDVALKWLEYDPFTYLRTPSKRCKKEFESLFEMEFHKKHDEGIYIKPNKTHLTVNYRPASGSLNRIFEKKLPNYPDVTKLTRYIEQFRIIAQECENELDAYSRYLGRKPDDSNSFMALSLLPSELLNSSAIKSVELIKEDLKSRIEKNIFSFIDVSHLVKLMDMNTTKLNKNEVVAILQFLSKIGIGIEPDLRFSSQLLKPGDKAIIFSITDKFSLTPSKEYSATIALITFAVCLSTADGNFSTEERDSIIQHVESSLKLNKPELVRITAYMDWLSATANQSKGLSSKVKSLSYDYKTQLVRFLLILANADGYISPEEIKSLKKIYKLFQFDEEKIYSDIHSIQTNTSDLTTVISGRVTEDGYNIPKEKLQGENLNLNEKIIEQTLRDTYKINEILTNIFEEDNQKENTQLSNITADSGDTVLGLDQQHMILLSRLVQKERWEQTEYETLCNELNLLPEGAIETLNQTFFNRFGDDLIIVDDDLEINVSLVQNNPSSITC